MSPPNPASCWFLGSLAFLVAIDPGDTGGARGGVHPIGSFGEKGLWFVRDHRFIVGQVGKFDGQPASVMGWQFLRGRTPRGRVRPNTAAAKTASLATGRSPFVRRSGVPLASQSSCFGLGGTKAVETQGLAGAVDGNTVFGKATFRF